MSSASHAGSASQAGQPGWRVLLPAILAGTLVAAAMLVVVVFVWTGFGHFNDFRTEAWPAYRALSHGHPLNALRIAPAYFGSLILRAPFALLAGAFGAGWRGTYVATALPCLIAAPVLGAWLSVQPRSRVGTGPLSRISPIALCCLNPLVVIGVILGHPEDVLGAVLCIGAVVLAVRGDTRAGLLLGFALINKSWAIVAFPVVLAVMPSGRWRALAIAAGTAALMLVPGLIVRDSGLAAAGAASSLGGSVGTLFLVPQLLYWFGPHAWIVRESHLLIPVVCTAVAATWWVVRGRGREQPVSVEQALLLLALVLLLRAALDPWDNIYYHVPFLLALMAYEARRRPALTFLYTIVLVVVVPPRGLLPISPQWHAATYAMVAIPTILWLAARVFEIPGLRATAARGVMAYGR